MTLSFRGDGVVIINALREYPILTCKVNVGDIREFLNAECFGQHFFNFRDACLVGFWNETLWGT